MDVQYQFLIKLKKLGGNQNHSVLIADIKSKWRKYPGHNVIVLCVKAEYFQTGYECYRANSYTLTPEGREWIQKERDSKISKWAAVIAAVLSRCWNLHRLDFLASAQARKYTSPGTLWYPKASVPLCSIHPNSHVRSPLNAPKIRCGVFSRSDSRFSSLSFLSAKLSSNIYSPPS